MKQSQCPLYAVAMMKSMFLVLCALFGFSAASQCRHPPAAEGYTNEKYSGIWYEIGRVCHIALYNKPLLLVQILCYFRRYKRQEEQFSKQEPNAQGNIIRSI